MLLFAAPAFCGSVNLFTNARPDMTASVDLSACLKRDLRTAPFIMDSRFSADFKELYFDCGSALQDQKFDFTTNVFYMPTFLEKFRAGLGFGYHFYRYFNEFSENAFKGTTIIELTINNSSRVITLSNGCLDDTPINNGTGKI